MGLLFMMRDWALPSELWMQRMIEALEPHIAVLAAANPTEPSWRGRLPVSAVRDAPPGPGRRVAHALGLKVWQKPAHTGHDVVRRLVHRADVDRILVHYLDWAAHFIDIWEQTDKPLFVHSHGHDAHPDCRWEHKPGERFFGPDYAQKLLRLSKRAVFLPPAEATRGALLRIGVPEQRIVLRRVGAPVVNPLPTRPPRVEGLTILYLGRLSDCKGPDLTIRAFELACARGLDARLVLAGDGALRITCELLRQRSPVRDRIELLGSVKGDVAQRLLREADLFTAHSCLGPISRIEEGFGTAFAEAMGCGLVVVSGRSGGVAELIPDDSCGLLFEPGDIEAHARHLLELARDPARRAVIGAVAHRRIAEHFSLEQANQRLMEILGLAPPAPTAAAPAHSPATAAPGNHP